MKNKIKRILGILLSLVIVLGLMPGMNLTAYAATNYTSGTVNISQLEVGDAIGTGVQSLVALDAEDGYTVTLVSNGFGYCLDEDHFELATGDGSLSSNYFSGGNFVYAEIKLVPMYKSESGSVQSDYWYVIAIDHENHTMALSGDENATIYTEEIIGTKINYDITEDTIYNDDCTTTENGINDGVHVGDTDDLNNRVIVTINGNLYVNRSLLVNNGSYIIVNGNLTFNRYSHLACYDNAKIIYTGTVTNNSDYNNLTDYIVKPNISGNVTYHAASGDDPEYFTFGTSDTKYFFNGSTFLPITGLSLDKSTADVDEGSSVSLTAIVTPGIATDKTVKWSVGGTNADAVTLYSDETCNTPVGSDATETLTVYAKGISAGTATVTCTSNADSNKTASCNVTVNAAATAYDLWVGGIQVTSANASDVFGAEDGEGATVSYDASTSTLTLNGATINESYIFHVPTGSCAAIYTDYDFGDLTINVTDDSIVTGSNNVYESYGICISVGELTVTGSGSLAVTSGSVTAEGASYGVYARIGVTVDEGATLTTTSGSATHEDGGNSYGVYTLGDVTVNDGATLTVTAGSAEVNSNAIYAHGVVNVNVGATLTATTVDETRAIYAGIKNAIAGTAWTDFNEMVSIGINTEDSGQQISNKKVVFPAVQTYSVTITEGTGMSKTNDSGAASQTCIGAMTAVVYTANDGYYFPEDYSATAVNGTSDVNGISVTRDSISQITVSGTPTDDTEITLTAPSLIVPTGVSLDKHEINVNDHDGDQSLTATISPNGATGTLVWSNSNSSVASVASNDDNTATVTINGVGTAIITVTIQGTSISDVCTVTVAEYVCPHDNKIETPQRDATCTEAGNNKYYYCADCNKYLKADGTTVTTQEAETIPALGHNYEGVAYSLDDTQHWKVCCRCYEDSAKENHFFGDTTYTWSNDNTTCTALHTCEVCGKEVREIVNTTTQVTQPATCTNSEITKYTAVFTKDGFEVQTKDVETGNALGHVWGAHWYEWSDDYSTVTAKRRCTRADCNETQTETVETSVETTATCTEAGTTTYTATFTYEVFNDDSMFDDGNGRTKNVAVDSLGHDWNTTAAVPATCTTAGNNEYKKCNRCGEYNVEENSWVVPALGHSFVYDANGATVTATCEHDGCKYKNAPAKLTIVAPTLTTFGGTGSESATLTGLTDFNTATGLSVSADSIRYFKATKNGTTYTKSGSALTSAPTDAGDYLAEITVSGVKTGAETTGNVTAGLGYTIAKEAPIHSDGTISTSGIYCMSNHPSIQAGINIQKSNEADTVEYRWVGCNTNDPMKWFEVSPWTKNNNWMDWTPEKSGDYVFVCYARVVGNEEASQIEYSFGTEYHKGIKGICQMPYTGEGGGYLIGIESFDNPNNSYQYEMLILDCSLLAQGKDAWIYSTGRCGAQDKSLWTVWQPEYGYYWTLFRIYDSNGNLIDETCYGFANIY